MSQPRSWIWKSLLLSAAFALAIWLGCYLFFRIHQELEVQPSRCWRIGVVAFFLGAISNALYFRMRAER
jgi:hypothetical protein